MIDWAAMLIGLSFGPAVLLKATALLALAWCVHGALCGRNPRWRVFLWRATLVALAVLPAAEWALPRLEVAVMEDAAPPPVSAPVIAEPLSLAFESLGPVDVAIPALKSVPFETAVQRFRITTWMADHVTALLCAVWVAVSFLFLLGIARAWRNVHTIVAHSVAAPTAVHSLAERIASELGVTAKVDVRIADQLGSPFLTGLRRPVIVLSARSLEESDTVQLRAVLAHELAHVKTHDPFWMTLARFAASLFWFHPLMWRMRSAHNGACEDVCDCVAGGYLGSPDTYSKALAREALALLDARPVPGGVPMLRSAEIVQRLRKIQRGVRANPLARRWVATSLIIAAGLLVTLGSLKLVQARPAEDGTSEFGSQRTSDDSSENPVAAAKPDLVLPSIEIGAGEEPVVDVPGLQVELLGVVGIEPTLIAADGRGVEPDVWGTRVEDAIRTHWEDVRERRFGATENGTNVGLLFRLRPEIQSLREYELLDAVLIRGNLSSNAVLTVGGPVGDMAEDRIQIMQIRSDQALELPDHMDVTANVSYGPPLDTYADIPVNAESAAIEMKEWKFTATVRKLPDTKPDGEIPHEERPEVTLTFSAGGPLINFRVVAIDQQGNPIEPYANPHLDDLRHGHDYTWKFGFPEPILKQSIQGFRLIGYPLQPITWKNVPFVTNTGAREYRPRFSTADIIAVSYEIDGEPWWPEVRQTYGLSQGEAVRFIGADRAPAVQDYIAARRRGSPSSPDAIVMFWDTKLDGWPEESSAYREADVLASETFTFSDIEGYQLKDLPATLCRELTGADLHVAGKVADIVIKGDWSVAFDAPLEDKMHALEQILTKETGERIRIEQTNVEQPVIVASGTLDFRSIPDPPEKEGIYLYGAALGERHVAYGSETSLEGLVRTLSDQTHIAVVNEATDPDGHQYRGIYTMPSARMVPGEVDTSEGSRKLATTLQNLSEQTGLEFTIERRTCSVWNVTTEGDEAGPRGTDSVSGEARSDSQVDGPQGASIDNDPIEDRVYRPKDANTLFRGTSQEPGAIEGTVRLGGAPQEGADITIVKPETRNVPLQHLTKRDGHFKLRSVPAGEVVVRARLGLQDVPYDVPGRVLTKATSVDPGQTERLDFDFSTNTGDVAIRVVLQNTFEFDGQAICRVATDDGLEERIALYRDGLFILRDLPIGLARGRIGIVPKETDSLDPPKVNYARPFEVLVVPGETADISVRFDGTSTISGRVLGLSAGEKAVISVYEGSQPLPKDLRDRILRARGGFVTRESGEYRIDVLGAGTYTVLAKIPSGDSSPAYSSTRFAELGESETVTLDFDRK